MKNTAISAYDFHKRFPDEEAARDHLEARRWQGQPCCPFCGSRDRVRKRSVESFYRCLDCQKDFTVRTGTVFERSHVPLHKWLYAIYLISTSRKGISSLQLSKEIGVTQKTAWFMLQRLREACGNDDDDNAGGGGFLSGIIEADETYIGGKEMNRHASRKLRLGRGTAGKIAVLGLRERGGRVVGRVLPDTTASTIQSAIRGAVEPGTTLMTDEHASYVGMAEFSHSSVNHSAKEFVNGMSHTNVIESVWAVIKRGFYGVYHSFSRKHLQRYVDEFAYRLNEGNCNVPTMDRIDALLAKAVGVRVTYKMLSAKAPSL